MSEGFLWIGIQGLVFSLRVRVRVTPFSPVYCKLHVAGLEENKYINHLFL